MGPSPSRILRGSRSVPILFFPNTFNPSFSKIDLRPILDAARGSTSSDSDPDESEGVWTSGAPTSKTNNDESRSDSDGLCDVLAEFRRVWEGLRSADRGGTKGAGEGVGVISEEDIASD